MGVANEGVGLHFTSSIPHALRARLNKKNTTKVCGRAYSILNGKVSRVNSPTAGLAGATIHIEQNMCSATARPLPPRNPDQTAETRFTCRSKLEIERTLSCGASCNAELELTVAKEDFQRRRRQISRNVMSRMHTLIRTHATSERLLEIRPQRHSDHLSNKCTRQH